MIPKKISREKRENWWRSRLRKQESRKIVKQRNRIVEREVLHWKYRNDEEFNQSDRTDVLIPNRKSEIRLRDPRRSI